MTIDDIMKLIDRHASHFAMAYFHQRDEQTAVEARKAREVRAQIVAMIERHVDEKVRAAIKLMGDETVAMIREEFALARDEMREGTWPPSKI